MPASILIVDDESGIRESLGALLRDEGYDVEAVASGEECLDRLQRRNFDLVLLDVWLNGMDGLDTLERMQEHSPAPMVVMISGHGNIETAVRATKLGAFDFVEKPLSVEKVVLVGETRSNICASKKKTADCAPNSKSDTRFLARACR